MLLTSVGKTGGPSDRDDSGCVAPVLSWQYINKRYRAS